IRFRKKILLTMPSARSDYSLEAIRNKIGDLCALLGFGISTLYSLAYLLFVDSVTGAALNQVFAFGYLLYFLFKRHGKLYLARLSVAVNFIVQMLLVTIFFTSTESGLQYYYIVSGAVSYILHSHDARTRIILPLISVVCYLTLEISGNSYAAFQLDPRVFHFVRVATILTIFAIFIIIIRLFHRENDLQNRWLTQLSTTDPLTHLLNRRATQNALEREVARSKAQNSTFSILIGDIDHFKAINDHHGHQCGDMVLIKVAQTLRELLREQDAVSRWGGEEFLLLLPNTDAAHATALAERLRVSIENAPLQEHQHDINITMSFGGVEYQPHTTVEDMIQMADQLMYEAKRAGRNRVVFHNPMEQPNPVPT
ncbi:MAG: hypothetical protein B0D94_12075, partial [Candidatus Sedimenticola endophacoides]